ncbi:MAG: SDR family NAD(P)-dependent oxidoreductase [Thaumarchaeota archaeon]|nr:SDR family NAD(P)-dependent oxidoreductase [Nitrososphaerota archaeon]
MKVSRAIVTGGAGFIGSHIVDELIRRGVETYVVDDLSTGRLDNLSQHRGDDRLHMVIGDGRTIGSLLADVQNIDVLFHEAAIANVLRSVKEPMVVHDVNVNMSLEVMNFCREKGIRRMIFASSAAVYGVLGSVKANEGITGRPSSPYGASKLAVEDYLHAYHSTYGLEPVALRYFNVYGPRQAMSDYSGVITLFINRMLRRQPVTIYGDGSQTRDFVNVRDIVQANILGVERDDAVGEVFNVASGESTSILQLYDILRSVTHARDLEPVFAPPRPGDVRLGMSSIDKIEEALGYRKSVSMETGLHELLRYTLSQLEVQVQQQQRW